jgi:hypothetical protein
MAGAIRKTSPKGNLIMLETANDHDQQDLAGLRSWLVAMLEHPGVADIGGAFLMLLDRDLLVAVRKTYTIFLVQVQQKDFIDAVVDTVDDDALISLIMLCANQDLCFRTCFAKGRPDLAFSVTEHELPDGKRPAKRLYPFPENILQ